MNYDALSIREEMIFLAILALETDAYAYAIKQEIRAQAELGLSLGTIHTILYKLENKGFLKSELGGSSAKRGGRSKRLFHLTNKGQQLIQDVQMARQAMWKNISPDNLSLS